MKERLRSRLRGFLLHHRNTLTHSLFFPADGFANEIVIKEDPSNIPPERLRVAYGADAEEYLSSGKQNVETMFELLGRSDYKDILELGCAAGRMIRHLNENSWGVDISAEHINWCKANLPQRFATVTTVPHLPFRDGQFDLVFAGSVFTHIDDLADAWLAELARVCGGDVYLTIHDERTIELIESDGSYLSHHVRSNPFYERNKNDFDSLSIGRDTNSQVFYKREHFEKMMRQSFENVRSFPEAYGYQTAVIGSTEPSPLTSHKSG